MIPLPGCSKVLIFSPLATSYKSTLLGPLLSLLIPTASIFPLGLYARVFTCFAVEGIAEIFFPASTSHISISVFGSFRRRKATCRPSALALIAKGNRFCNTPSTTTSLPLSTLTTISFSACSRINRAESSHTFLEGPGNEAIRCPDSKFQISRLTRSLTIKYLPSGLKLITRTESCFSLIFRRIPWANENLSTRFPVPISQTSKPG